MLNNCEVGTERWSVSQVRELRRLLDESPEEGAERLDLYAVHVRASVLKGFFRDLPEPLLTFDLYDDFIMAAQISDPQVHHIPFTFYNIEEKTSGWVRSL